MIYKYLILILASAMLSVASADMMDRPRGFKIGERMTLYPYVSLSYTYDSNPDMSKSARRKGSQWMASPGMKLDYFAENWKLSAAAYYQYHAFKNYTAQQNNGSYGENLKYIWSNSLPNEKGWTLQLAQSYRKIVQDDDMGDSGGRGIWRDRDELQVDGALQRRVNSTVHATAVGNYYRLDYDNAPTKYAPLYGWSRAMLGGEIGYAPSKWTDFILHANYQYYNQDNSNLRDYSLAADSIYSLSNFRNIDSDSCGYSVMAGIGSYATERISYRLLAGWSRFEYGFSSGASDGFTYQLSGSWKYNNTLSFMVLGSSYFQPSERYYGTSMKVYTMSAGAAKSFIRGKLNAKLDVSVRKESAEYTVVSDYNHDEIIYSGRFGLTYILNRYVSFFGTVEFQSEQSSGTATRYGGHYYDYDRLRGTLGIRLTY